MSRLFKFVLLCATPVAMSGCGGGPIASTFQGAPQQDIRAQSNAGTSTDNPMTTVSLKMNGFESTVQAKLCVQKTTLEQAADATTASPRHARGRGTVASIDLSSIEGRGAGSNAAVLTEAKTGATVSGLALPGSYGAVVLEVGNSCGTGKSIELANGKGQFATSDTLQLRFAGAAHVRGDRSASLTLDGSPFASRFAKVESAQDISAAIKASEGTVALGQ